MSGKHEMLNANLSNIRESLGNFDRTTSAPAVGPRAASPKMVGVTRSRDVSEIELDRIVPDPDQPRKEFDPDALERLAESLKTRGQLQPIQVRWSDDAGRYVVLLGERRWRAAQMAGMTKIQCVVRETVLGDDERLSIQLIENALREDLSPVEQARAFRILMDRQGWTGERLADELTVSKSQVAKTLSLLKLPAAVQEQVEQGGLAPSAAYELARLDDPIEQIRLATTATEQGLTRDDVARQVRTSSPSRKKKPTAKKLPPAMVWRFNGYRVEVSRKAGVDAGEAAAALEEAAARLRATIVGGDAEAA